MMTWLKDGTSGYLDGLGGSCRGSHAAGFLVPLYGIGTVAGLPQWWGHAWLASSASLVLWQSVSPATHWYNMRWSPKVWDLLPGLYGTHPGGPHWPGTVREWQPCVPQCRLSVWGPPQSGSEGHGRGHLLCRVAFLGHGRWSSRISSVEGGSGALWGGCCPVAWYSAGEQEACALSQWQLFSLECSQKNVHMHT